MPSDTEITMLGNVAISAAVGVPERRPLVVSNVAHDGLFAMPKASTWPSGSAAVGTNEYACPAVTLDTGVPLMVGARFPPPGGGVVLITVIENEARLADASPTETEIVTVA
jgi:hypothetical protein